MREFRYYEKIAAKLYEIDPGDLFLNKRSPPIVAARNLCIYYRNKKLGFGKSASTKRYGRDHAVIYNVIKKVEDYRFSSKTYAKIFDYFSSECDRYLDNINDEVALTKNNIGNVAPKINAIIKNFVNLQKALFDYLSDVDFDETCMNEHVDICDLSLNEIKNFFNYDANKGDLGNPGRRRQRPGCHTA